MDNKPQKPTVPYGLEPIVIKMADSSEVYGSSSKIHKWYTVQHSIESMKMAVSNLKLQIEATEKTICDRERLLHSLRMEAYSATDPIQLYMEDKE